MTWLSTRTLDRLDTWAHAARIRLRLPYWTIQPICDAYDRRLLQDEP